MMSGMRLFMWARHQNRVRQYFQSSRNKGAKIEQMVTHIARFEYINTDSELRPHTWKVTDQGAQAKV